MAKKKAPRRKAISGLRTDDVEPSLDEATGIVHASAQGRAAVAGFDAPFQRLFAAYEHAAVTRRPLAIAKINSLAALYRRDEYLYARTAARAHHAHEARDKAMALEALASRYRHRRETGDGGGPTPEQLTHPPHRDEIARLVEKGSLEPEALQDAVEIREIYEHVVSGLLARSVSLDGGGGGQRYAGGDALDRLPYRLSLMHGMVYLPWTRDLASSHGGRALEIALSIIIDGYSVKQTALRIGARYATALRLLKIAMWDYREKSARFHHG